MVDYVWKAGMEVAHYAARWHANGVVPRKTTIKRVTPTGRAIIFIETSGSGYEESYRPHGRIMGAGHSHIEPWDEVKHGAQIAEGRRRRIRENFSAAENLTRDLDIEEIVDELRAIRAKRVAHQAKDKT